MGAGMEGVREREPQSWLQAGKGSRPTTAGPRAASPPARAELLLWCSEGRGGPPGWWEEEGSPHPPRGWPGRGLPCAWPEVGDGRELGWGPGCHRRQGWCGRASVSSSSKAALLWVGREGGRPVGEEERRGVPKASGCPRCLVCQTWLDLAGAGAKASTLRGVGSGWRGRARPSCFYVLLKSGLCCGVCRLCPLLEAVPLSLGFSARERWATLSFCVRSELSLAPVLGCRADPPPGCWKAFFLVVWSC